MKLVPLGTSYKPKQNEWKLKVGKWKEDPDSALNGSISIGGAPLPWQIWPQFPLQVSVSVLMWHWYSDRGVSQSGPPKRRVDICCLWGPVTWNYRLNQVLSISFALLHLLPRHFPLHLPLFSTSCLIFCLRLCTLLFFPINHIFSLCFYSDFIFLASLSHLPLCLLSSPSPLPLGHEEGADPASRYWVLLKLKLCQLACSQAVPKPRGSGDLSNTRRGNARYTVE